jgi:3-hydroxyisobutyrate dehydrogenase
VNDRVLGFFGLGRMGAPIARRLAQAGYRVVGFDPALRRAGDEGAVALARSPEELAAETEIVFLSLPDGAAVQMVCDQVVHAEGSLVRFVVDLSTIGIRAARSCASLLDAAGVAYVDAPVSGGVAGARTGALTMMVGADTAVFAALRPFLELVAQTCFHVGAAPGQGQAMKLLNNFVSATALAATSEAVVFGGRLGLDLSQMIDVLNTSSGRTTASSEKFPRSVIPGTYDFGFAGALMAKDVALYLEAAEADGAPRQVAERVAEVWTQFTATHSDADFTYIHKYVEGSETKPTVASSFDRLLSTLRVDVEAGDPAFEASPGRGVTGEDRGIMAGDDVAAG